MIIQNILVCPVCKSDLSKKGNEFYCSKCDQKYETKEEIYDFLVSGEDQWRYFKSGIFGGNKELEDKFLNTPNSELATSDLLLKGLIYWYKGNFPAYEKIINNPREGFYTEEYQSAMKSSMEYCKEIIKHEDGKVMDLASGMGDFLKELIKDNDREFISVDISPTSSYGLKQYLKYIKKNHLVTQIVADAKLLPFKNDSINLITTAAGFQNMEDGEKVYKELRRVSKKLNGICIFMEENDPNLKLAGDKKLHVKESFKEGLEKAGWKVHFENEIKAKGEPTPKSEILGVRPDTLPETPTTFEFAVVVGE